MPAPFTFSFPSPVLLTYTGLALGIYGLLGLLVWLKPIEAAKKPYLTWLGIIPCVFLPLWLGSWAWALAVGLLSLLAIEELHKATPALGQWALWVIRALIVGFTACSIFDNYPLFMALPIWGIVLLSLIPIFKNQYEGALVQLGLGSVGVIYFGWFLGHLGYLANCSYGLGYLLYVLIFTQLNDALCFLWGKTCGRTNFSVISPNKTIEGSVLGLLSSLILAFFNWTFAFPHFSFWQVALAGVIVGLGGQLGDLVMSGFKRDLGIKDFGELLPGHGGVLDRVDSLIWVAPVFFHFARFFHGV